MPPIGQHSGPATGTPFCGIPVPGQWGWEGSTQTAREVDDAVPGKCRHAAVTAEAMNSCGLLQGASELSHFNSSRHERMPGRNRLHDRVLAGALMTLHFTNEVLPSRNVCLGSNLRVDVMKARDLIETRLRGPANHVCTCRRDPKTENFFGSSVVSEERDLRSLGLEVQTPAELLLSDLPWFFRSSLSNRGDGRAR